MTQARDGASRVTDPPFPPMYRRVLGLLVSLGLTACVLAPGSAGPTRILLFDGSVQIAAPPGYCVITDKSTQTADSAVVLIGRCQDGALAKAAVVTVTVGAPGSAAVLAAGGDARAAFFTSPAGRATLAPSGRANDVAVSKAVMAGADFLILLTDRQNGSYWRAITALKGRLVTVSALGTDAAPLAPEDSRDLLNAALLALHRANPAPSLPG